MAEFQSCKALFAKYYSLDITTIIFGKHLKNVLQIVLRGFHIQMWVNVISISTSGNCLNLRNIIVVC